MKTIFLILVMGLLIGIVSAEQPARKPFLQIKIDGKPSKIGDIIAVTPGQKLNISVELEGGRRDFCKFPDTYSDLAGSAQILSRGDNGITYSLDGVKSEWKLLSEGVSFSSDNSIKIKSLPNQHTAELTITKEKFSQSFVKASVKANWQFSQDGKTSTEEDVAEATIYFKMEGASDAWFTSKNIQASGIKDDRVQEKLSEVQLACDSIEKNFHRLNFSGVQQSIRNLQGSVNTLKLTIDEVKTENTSYQTNVAFIGLPSDDPFSDIEKFNTVKTNWTEHEALVNDLKMKVQKLSEQPTNENKKELLGLINQYAEWLSKLPETTFKNLSDYIPEIKPEDVRLPENLAGIVAEKSVSDYPKTLSDFAGFVDKRIEQVPNENQLINSIHSRLQAVRLFDGMLRSYFSSITWAEWKSTRGF